MISDKIYELKLDDFITAVDPTKYNIQATPENNIDPRDYFITSGDAVQKTLAMEADLVAAVKAAKKLYQKGTKKQLAFIKALSDNVTNCRKLISALKKIRGDAIFLENEWGPDRKLYILPKNPRNKKDVL